MPLRHIVWLVAELAVAMVGLSACLLDVAKGLGELATGKHDECSRQAQLPNPAKLMAQERYRTASDPAAADHTRRDDYAQEYAGLVRDDYQRCMAVRGWRAPAPAPTSP